jgi:ribosomal subunit interface protein
MKINLQCLHFRASDHLKNFVEEKVGKLEHLDESIMGAEVILFAEEGQSVNNKFCEIRLQIPGDDNFVKKNADSYEAAILEAVDVLHELVKRKKERV